MPFNRICVLIVFLVVSLVVSLASAATLLGVFFVRFAAAATRVRSARRHFVDGVSYNIVKEKKNTN